MVDYDVLTYLLDRANIEDIVTKIVRSFLPFHVETTNQISTTRARMSTYGALPR
jgi:hypothetical protein